MNKKILNIIYIALFAGIITVCSLVSIPFSVPLSLQSFAVFLCVGLLGTYRGTLSVLLYIFLGVIGLPVFAGFRGGIGMLLDTTGGYILGFVLAALVSGLISHILGKTFPRLCIAMIAGTAVLYLFGTIWYSALYNVPVGGALLTCVVPFIIPDLLKIVACAALTARLHPIFEKAI